MNIRARITLATLVVFAALSLTACGSKPAALSDIPAYPGATALQAGESALADTLAQNNQTDAAMRGQLGVGGQTEQQGYSLPQDVTWEQVKGFYEDELKGDGWGTNSMVSGMMEQMGQGNDVFKTANWQKGGQSVTVVMLTSPIDPSVKELVISLSTQ